MPKILPVMGGAGKKNKPTLRAAGLLPKKKKKAKRVAHTPKATKAINDKIRAARAKRKRSKK